MKKIIFLTFLLLLSFTFNVFSEPKVIEPGKIIVYPNPWIPESGIATVEGKDNTLKHGHLSSEGWIKFAGVTKNTGTIRIYDVTGNLVRNFHWNVTDEKANFPVPEYLYSHRSSGQITYEQNQEWIDKEVNHYNIIHWDGKDNNFEYVKSGVYIWILSEDGGLTHHGKIAVVR